MFVYGEMCFCFDSIWIIAFMFFCCWVNVIALCVCWINFGIPGWASVGVGQWSREILTKLHKNWFVTPISAIGPWLHRNGQGTVTKYNMLYYLCLVLCLDLCLDFCQTHHRCDNQGQDDDNDQEGDEYAAPVPLVRIAGDQLCEMKRRKVIRGKWATLRKLIEKWWNANAAHKAHVRLISPARSYEGWPIINWPIIGRPRCN